MPPVTAETSSGKIPGDQHDQGIDSYGLKDFEKGRFEMRVVSAKISVNNQFRIRA